MGLWSKATYQPEVWWLYGVMMTTYYSPNINVTIDKEREDSTGVRLSSWMKNLSCSHLFSALQSKYVRRAEFQDAEVIIFH